jgi:hypothetical protein
MDEVKKHDKEVISETDYYKIGCMAAHVKDHKAVRKVFPHPGGQAEVTIRSQLGGVECQSRIDWLDLDNKTIVDLKTCADLGSKHTEHFPCKFARDSKVFGYANQLAFYRSMVYNLTGEVFKVFIVAAEKAEPFEVGLFEMSATTLDAAEQQNQATVKEYKNCVETDNWPSRFCEPILL